MAFGTSGVAFIGIFMSLLTTAIADPKPDIIIDVPGSMKMPAFGNLAWGMSPAQARAAMVAKGYTFTSARSSDLHFKGTVDRQPASITLMFSPTTGLVKQVVWIHTNTRNLSEARRTYDDVVSTLQKYGTPKKAEIYSYPYKEGDGDEDQALRAGKLDIFSIWTLGERNGHPYGVSVNIDTDMEVYVSYESPFWQDESRRRKAKANSDL